METNKQSNSPHTFFLFGLTIYLTSFLSLIHFYRVIKDTFRGDFRDHFYTWSFRGLDFNYLYSHASKIFTGKGGLSIYPPWAAVSYYPLTLFDVNTAYLLFSYILVAVLFFSIFLCIRENKVFSSMQMTLFIALLCTGLFYHTYPVLFAIERGNFDMLAGFFAAAGLFALSRNFRKTAVITLAIAAQYKIYPVILGSILFIRSGWKMLTAFIVMNILLLCIQGPGGMFALIKSLPQYVADPNLWPGNHSLASFAQEMVRLGHLPVNLQSIVSKVSSITIILIYAFTFFWFIFKRKPRIPSTFSVAEAGLIGMSFQIMSLLPSTGHDYKLPIHIIPFLLIISRNKSDFTLPKGLQYFLIAALSVSMAFLFVPFFLIKTFGIIASFIIYAVFTFSPKIKEPEVSSEHKPLKPA